MPVPDEPFGVALRRLRERSGLTQEQLAERAGLSSRAIRALEGGERRHPYPHTLRALAAALGLRSDEASALRATVPERDRPAGQAPAVSSMQTLPRAVASFTGRKEEMARLLDALAGTRSAASAIAVCAIDGMAGVGKTTFAVQAAHRLAADFPDGRLFLDLRGHAAGQPPLAARDALGSLLLSTGMPMGRIPQSLDDRAATWRDRAAGRRILILLDDAAGSEQVRPLLPGAGGCLTLITSRRRLAALEDAVPLTLGTLPTADGSALLARLIGAERLDGDSTGAAELVQLSGQLPLAIRILAGRLRSHPTWSVRDLTSTLRRARDRLGEMRVENLAIEATFELSYQGLPDARKRLFRRLGLHPGQEIDVYAAAALDGCTPIEARRGLESLYDDHLLDEPMPGRYRFHDLVRDYARALVEQDDAPTTEAGLDRLLDWYLDTTITASRHLLASGERGAPIVTPVGDRSPDLTSRQTAVAWLEVERANLCACVQHAATHGRQVHALRTAHAMHSFLRDAGCWDQALANGRAAVRAARQAGDRDDLARALMDLGDVERLFGEYQASIALLTEALTVLRELGDRPGQARALTELGRAQRLTAGKEAATATLTEALTLFRELGDRLGEARTLRSLGLARQEFSDYAGGRAHLVEALALFRELGDPLGEANALESLGTVQFWTGEYREAAQSLAEALRIHGRLGNRFGQANAMNMLGRVQCQVGHHPAAAASHTGALGIYRDLGSTLGEENALAYLAVVQRSTGDYEAAGASLRTALTIGADLGDRAGRANALTELAIVQRLVADRQGAAASLGEALSLCRAIHDRIGEVEALNCLGDVLLDMGDRDAVVHHRAALHLAREVHCPLEEARALEGIGHGLAWTGGSAAGIEELRQALEIYERLGVPEASRLAAELGRLRSTA